MSEPKDVNPDSGELRCSSSDPFDDGKDSQQHLTECIDDNCERCQHLIDGFLYGLRYLRTLGSPDASGWVLVEGIPFCSESCAVQWFGGPVEIQ